MTEEYEDEDDDDGRLLHWCSSINGVYALNLNIAFPDFCNSKCTMYM